MKGILTLLNRFRTTWPELPKNPIICVDFDGVIHSYSSGWKGVDVIPDPPVDGAIEWLLQHLPLPDALGISGPYEGPEVVIYSSRSKDKRGIKAMRQWLIKWGVDEWYFRDDILKFPTQKPAAVLTLDDRAICFNGRFPTTAEMLAFKPWNKVDVSGNQLASKSESPSEKERRIYYQNIVYAVCNLIDRANGKHPGVGVVCGTVDSPSNEVQKQLERLLSKDESDVPETNFDWGALQRLRKQSP